MRAGAGDARASYQMGTVEHLRVELGEDTFATGFILADTRGLDGGIQNNCLASMCTRLRLGRLAEPIVNEVAVGLAAGKQHPSLSDCAGSFQLVLQFWRSLSGKESKVIPCFPCSASRITMESAELGRAFLVVFCYEECHVSISCVTGLCG